jgi:hypothetical protein
MARISTYASATAAAFLAFAMAGGIRAAENVVKAEERASAAATATTLGSDAQIPFPNSGNIRDWRADGSDALYVEDVRGHWYHATLLGPCIDLPTADQIAFLTRGPDQLDKFSSIAVRGQTCAFSSLVTSAPPPKGGKVKAVKAVPPAA